jgi:gliding motility-associated-like protein
MPAVNSCATISGPILPGATFNLGTTPVTYTAVDAAGNEATCTFNVIVTDAIAPEIVGCPLDFEVELTATESSQVVFWTPPTVNTACATMTSNYIPGMSFAPGMNTISYTAVDAAGNTSVCSFKLTVKDKIPPVFSNYAVEVEAASVDETCGANVTWVQPTITDNCGVLSWESSRDPGDRFDVGTTRVTYEAIDVNGNTSTCDINIVVKNGILPVIVDCPNDISIRVGESGEGLVSWTPPTATIPCGDVTLTSSHLPGDNFSIGTTRVEYVATDAAGEFSTCSFDVVVAYEDFIFDIAKVVTPDGNSMNDFWELGNIEKFNDNSVMIVDRWGGLIYSANGYNNGNVAWRGTNRSGDLVPTGTYFYTISVRFRNSRIEKKGFIELIR